MELIQVFHKKIPQKEKFFTIFRKQQSQDISKIILQMIKGVKKSTKCTKMMNLFCIELYDMLYYYIMFDKVIVAKKLLRVLEQLALPIKHVGENRRNELFKKMIKMKI